MSKSIVLVSSDDWMGLYINGELRDEGHEITLKDFFHALNIEDVTLESKECDYDWLENLGCLPEKLEDVKFL